MKKSIVFILICFALSAFALSASAENAVLLDDKCENGIENVKLQEGSWDGTKYYRCDAGVDIGYLPYEMSSDFIYELDIRFNNEGCGFSFMKKGKWNSCIRIKDGHLALQTGGNSFTKLCAVDLDAWYHFTFLGRTNKDANSVTYGHIILERYDNGKKIDRQVFKNVNLRNNAATHYINVFGGCDIDNLYASVPAPTKIELTADAESVVAGGSVQFSALSFYNDLEMHGVNTSDITFEMYNAEGTEVLEDENIAIDINGLLTTKPLTASQEICVRAVSKSSGLYAEKKLKVMTGSIFTVMGIGVSENGDEITQLTVKKNFAAYKDNVTFAVAFYNKDNSFKCIDFKSVSAKVLNEGENYVNMNIKVPESFDVYNDKMCVFTLTSLSAREEAVRTEYDKLPQFDGKCTVIAIKDDADITKVRSEDVLYFDVTEKDNMVLPEEGRVYIMGSVEKLDTLFEIIK